MSKLSWPSERLFVAAELSALLPLPSLTGTPDYLPKNIILIKDYSFNKDIRHLPLTMIHLRQNQCRLHHSIQPVCSTSDRAVCFEAMELCSHLFLPHCNWQ